MTGERTLDLDGKVDLVHADNLSTGEPLPRIAPTRATVGLTVQQGAWTGRAEVQRSARQSRVPSDDVATPAWTMLNLSASYRLAHARHDVLVFAKLNNVGNTLAFNASSVNTVRPLSPPPGRALMLGVRATF